MLKESEMKLHTCKSKLSLNPYFNGTCSKRYKDSVTYDLDNKVLILILMEHAQRVP